MPPAPPDALGASPTAAAAAGPNLLLARMSARLGVGTESGDEHDTCAAAALREDISKRRRAAAMAARRSVSVSGTGQADGRPAGAAGGQGARQSLLELPPEEEGLAFGAPSLSRPPPSDADALSALLLTKLNVLLLGVPVAVVAHALHWGPVAVFAAAFAALIPLASLLAVITESLAGHLGDTLGGLLLATGGNIPELCVSIAALRQGLFDVVSVSLLGSILSNMLLVLGCCHIAGAFSGGGGARGRCPRHGTLAVKAYSSMLLLACLGLSVGTATAHLPHDHLRPGGALAVSRGVAVLLLFTYAAFLFFTMGTHAQRLEVEAAAAAAASAAEAGGGGGHEAGEEDDDDDDDDEDILVMSLPLSLAALVGVTVAVGVVSEYLVGAVNGVVAAGFPSRLLSLVVIPIAANATEHASSVIVAYRNKMDLAYAIALGSSLQIAVFVLPVCVVAAWAMGIPYSLELDPLLFLLLLLSVLHQQSVSADGRSDWLTGCQLIAVFVIVALPSAYMKEGKV